MAAAVSITESDGRLKVSGPLTFATVDRRLMESSRRRFAAKGLQQPVVVDLAGVEQGDTAGLALLIEWVRWSRLAGGSELRFENLPASLAGIAAISDVTDLLKLDAGDASAPRDDAAAQD